MKLEKAFLFAKLHPEGNEELESYINSMVSIFNFIKSDIVDGNTYIGLACELDKKAKVASQDLFNKVEFTEEGADYYVFPGRLYE